MAKSFLTVVCYDVLLLLSIVGTTMVVTVGAICSENLGPCDGNCKANCAAKHPGGLGSCDGSTCQCYFDCPPPPPPCHGGLGRCTTGCWDQCCNSNCAAKYPNGTGFCDDSLGMQNVLCQCTYPC